jgi:hypothetical protein
VPRRRIQVRYVTVTQMRGHSCTVQVPVVSVSAVVDDYPHGSICHTATTRRNRARARLESEPHDLDELPLSRLRGISPGSDKLSCFPGLLSTFRGSDTAGRTVEHGHIGTHWATTNFADNRDCVNQTPAYSLSRFAAAHFIFGLLADNLCESVLCTRATIFRFGPAIIHIRRR